MIERKSSPLILDFFLDLFLFAGLFIFLTGGFPIIQGSLHSFFQQKPWVHRASIAGLTACCALVLFWKTEKGRAAYTPLMRFFSSLKLTPISWTYILFITFSFILTLSSWLRHEILHSSFDMAIFAQALWNTLQGDFLYSSIKGGICLLGDHFSPLLALYSLPYLVWSDPLCLLLVQALAAASCVFPIYFIAKQKHDNAWVGVLFAFSFVLYLPVRNAVRFDFHPEILTMPLFLWAFWCLENKRLRWTTFLLLIALSSKESAALITFAFGFYAFLFCKEKKFGAFWMLLSITYFVVILRWVIPQISGKDYFYLAGNFLQWKEEGTLALLKHVFNKSSFAYLVKIFSPFAFLSFLHPPTLILTFPSLLQNLTARNEAVRSIFFQYTLYLTPFVVIASIYGAAKIRNKKYMAYLLLFFTLVFSGVSELYVMNSAARKWNSRTQVFDSIRPIIKDAPVRTHEFLAPHFTDRKQLHIYENNHPNEGGRKEALEADYVILDQKILGSTHERRVNQLKSAGYDVELQMSGFTLLKRRDVA